MDFIESLMAKIALIGVLGVGAQWIAWRTAKPAIALMLIAGIVAGPVTGIIVPARDFGDLMEPITKLAVAVILFEGGLSLNFRELRHAGSGVLRLVLVGVPIGWLLGTGSAHYGAGLSWPVSTLFGGILVVTGPTVIGPMLRSIRIGKRPADILKWEGIINDPIGALLAVLIFAYITYHGSNAATGGNLPAVTFSVGAATLAAAGIGTALGFAIAWAFPRGFVPEYLKAPMLLIAVIGGFVIADVIYHETGLVTVTVMGVVLANQPLFAWASLRRFKEDLAVLLISGLFILLPATLTWDVILQFEARFLVFLILILFVARPVTVLISLFFSSVPWRERLFIAWIAPRGIVAVAITGLFALRLEAAGVPDANALIPLSFGVVIATIVAHGFTAKWVARLLRIEKDDGFGVLLVGANAFTIELGSFLQTLDIPATITSENKLALRTAVKRGIGAYRGNVLDEVTEDHLDLGNFQRLIAATENDSHNALICNDLGPELGFESVLQVGPDEDNTHLRSRGRIMSGRRLTLETLIQRLAGGWRFRRTRLSEEFSLDDLQADLAEQSALIAVVRPSRKIDFFSQDYAPAAGSGDTVLSFTPA